MSVNEDKAIADFVEKMSIRYPGYYVIDNPSARRVRVVDFVMGDEELLCSFSYDWIYEKLYKTR